MRQRARWFWLVLGLFGAAGAVQADEVEPLAPPSKRIALVIGNDQYRSVTPLRNAVADSTAVAKALQEAGFTVTLQHNVDLSSVKQALRQFKTALAEGDEALFFFSGHGVQLGGANYLLPVDIVSDSEDQVRDDALALQRVLDDMSERKVRFALAIVDACRDNPFATQGRGAGGPKGLAATRADNGQLILFSAGSGQQALDNLGEDDRNPNGVFTRVFIQEMNRPGVEVHQVLHNVRSQVVQLAKSVGHDQMPALYDQMQGGFYFHTLQAGQGGEDAPAAVKAEIQAWQAIQNSTDPADFRRYVERYPNGAFVPLARIKGRTLVIDNRFEPKIDIYTVAEVEFALVEIPGGSFEMGFTQQYRNAEQPRHTVTLPPFQMMQTEVTQRLWQAVMGSNPSKHQGDDLPVEQVSWQMAQSFVAKLNQMTGQHFSLPSESQWEYAARAGTITDAFWGSAYLPDEKIGRYAWFSFNNDDQTHPVAQKEPNPWKLYDMAGNVSEWCQDAYHESYKESRGRGGLAPDDGTPWEAKGLENYKVVRGGFAHFLWPGRGDMTSSGRAMWYDNQSSPRIGLRLVLLPQVTP
ncbi:MAG: hypothetical protein COX57_04665 [Alphaproteobacteria bacterium CG_4_10_14_0_2_um_filter_63_37]|nr:MAG: hypothetical protein AUJ55_13185 [Proteobacteria bacterium CG1_02_64_396]PJA25191.1 MAG: hypothetical protein COX57_04665 [Alphaproteobacteria bacterium CG_4_10_14_0_2_um_filter_63_37]